MDSGLRRRRRSLCTTVFAAVLVVATACGGGIDEPPTAEPVEADRSVARTVDQAPAQESSVLDDLTLNPEGVINAAVLLHSGGDVGAALAAGSFTSDELDAARLAMADGSLDYLFE